MGGMVKMKIITKIEIEMIKQIFTPGTVVVCDYMDDPQPVPSGTKGVVTCVDSIGQIHVNWENGSTLALNYEVDKFHEYAGRE